MRRSIAVAVLALGLTGCGSVVADSSETTDRSVAPQTTQEDGTAAESDDEAGAYDSAPGTSSMLVVGEEDPANPGFHVGPEFTTKHGTYHRILLPDDHPVRTLDESVATDEVLDAYTPEQLSAALSVTSEFAVQELVTSQLAFDFTPQRARDWWKTHGSTFAPGAEDIVLPVFASNDPDYVDDSRALLYSNNGWDRGIPTSSSQVENLEIGTTSMTMTDDGLTITHLVSFDAPVRNPDGTEGTFVEHTGLAATYSLVLVDGQWKIGSYTTRWQTSY